MQLRNTLGIQRAEKSYLKIDLLRWIEAVDLDAISGLKNGLLMASIRIKTTTLVSEAFTKLEKYVNQEVKRERRMSSNEFTSFLLRAIL